MTTPEKIVEDTPEVDEFEVYIAEVTKLLHVGTINAYEANKMLLLNHEKALQAERQRCEEIAQRAFHEGCSSGMDEYRTSRGGKPWQETNTYKSLTQPNNPK